MRELNSLPPESIHRVDQEQSLVRDIVDREPKIVQEIQKESSIGVMLASWGLVIADDILCAGDYDAMQWRALGWMQYLGGLGK